MFRFIIRFLICRDFRCNLICHIGECSSKSTCKKKTKLYCPCKRLKVEFQCNRAQSQTVQCDQECQSLKLKVSNYVAFFALVFIAYFSGSIRRGEAGEPEEDETGTAPKGRSRKIRSENGGKKRKKSTKSKEHE